MGSKVSKLIFFTVCLFLVIATTASAKTVTLAYIRLRWCPSRLTLGAKERRERERRIKVMSISMTLCIIIGATCMGVLIMYIIEES